MEALAYVTEPVSEEYASFLVEFVVADIQRAEISQMLGVRMSRAALDSSTETHH